jgi:hypothetical protein
MNEEFYIGVYNKEEEFETAVINLNKLNIDIEELYMPVPVHQAVKKVAGSSKLPMLAYFFGLFAIVSVLSFLYYTAVISWPLNIGGKPSNAFPSFIIVTLVLTILSVTLLTFLAFSISANLYPGKEAIVFDKRALNDKFIIVLKSDKVPDAKSKLLENGANEIILK